ncbi:unnamed protein product [Polarella glacialis]|uniref:Uncharacterized protein n=1 Tax=Polarella glacialis TaxID=89957 RepID=A0A813HNG1_POLGL|nr:unnamed protein product [Polarella glacialis]
MSIWLSVPITGQSEGAMESLVPAGTNGTNGPARKRARATTADSMATTIRNLVRLALSNAAQVRLLKAAAIRTLLFPADNPTFMAAKQAGARYNEMAQQRGGQTSLPPPHLAVFTAILQAVAADSQVPPQIAAAATTMLANTAQLPHLIFVCKTSKCFDKNKGRLEVALHPQCAEFLEGCTRTWVQQGAREMSGPAPRGPLERILADTLTEG